MCDAICKLWEFQNETLLGHFIGALLAGGVLWAVLMVLGITLDGAGANPTMLHFDAI